MAEDSGSDWEPDTHTDKKPTSSLANPRRQKRRCSSSSTDSPDESSTSPNGLGDAASSTPNAGHSRGARGGRGRGRGRGRRGRELGASSSPPAPHTAAQQWHTADDSDVEPDPLIFMPERLPGPQLGTLFARSPMDFFRLFFTDAVLGTLLANTNAYGAKKQEGKKGAWREITVNDMYSFFAMVIYMGLLKCTALVDYWKGTRLYTLPFPASVVSRKKFLTICCALHLSDIKTDEKNDARRGRRGHDRLAKIRPLYDQIVESCKSHFQPSQHISVDERTVEPTTRTLTKHYIRDKPNKWGYKLFALADSNCGYTWNFYVYDGKSYGSGKGLGYDSVMSLVDFDCLGTGYRLYADDFYTSPTLFQDLLKKGVGACGTIRASRVGFPKTKVNDFTKTTPRGTVRWIRDGEVLFVKWMDIREVAMCSTIHKALDDDTVRRNVKTDGKWVTTDVPIPAAVKDYNEHIGGFDLSDVLIGYNSVLQRTRKWYRTFFYHFVDIAVANAHILHQQCGRGPAMTQIEFRQALVEELADHGSKTTSQVSTKRYTAPPNPTATHKLRYFSEGLVVPKRKRGTVGRRTCVLCHRKTPVGCASCDVPLCFMAKRDCFNPWHKQRGL